MPAGRTRNFSACCPVKRLEYYSFFALVHIILTNTQRERKMTSRHARDPNDTSLHNGAWVDVRDPGTRRLLFRFDPKRLLVESMCAYWDESLHKRVRFVVVTDLTQIVPALATFLCQSFDPAPVPVSSPSPGVSPLPASSSAAV